MFLAASLCGADCGGCGPGEVAASDGSSCYFHSTTDRTWTQAQTARRGRGAGWDLATVSSSTENAFLHSMVVADTWLGYNRISGPWQWSGGSSGYVNFAAGEPNGGDRARYSSGSSSAWFDRACSESYDFI